MDALLAQRSQIESELLAITQELMRPLPDGKPPVGLKGNLVDKDGFPRADVDLVRITTLRHRMAILNTDLANLMKEIEATVLALHASSPPRAAAVVGTSPAPALSGKERRAALEPFAKVAEVFAGSPAATCGLKAGDLIVQFGSLDKAQISAQGFAVLASVVSPGTTLKVYIEPADGKGRRTVFLTPGPWSGQGMLGCKLVQLT